MDEMDHTVKAALDTILWFEDSLTEVEARTGDLFHVLEKHNIDPEAVYEIFKVFSQIRFHLAESHEYQALLTNRQSKKNSRSGLRTSEQEQSLQSLAGQQNGGAQQPAHKQPHISLHKRLESRVAAFIKGSLFPLRKAIPQADQTPLA